jgi:transcriptional antiterminator NusG
MSDFNELNQGPKWYVVHTYSGYENKVKDYLEKMVENRHLSHLIYDIQIPTVTETVVNEKGEQKEVEAKLFPTYVLVKMTMTDESWHVVRNITGVTGFVGPGSKPVPLTDQEIEDFNVETHTEEFAFKVGDKVSVISGMFEGYEGTITDISEDKKDITLLVSTGTRDIPVFVEAADIRAAK